MELTNAFCEANDTCENVRSCDLGRKDSSDERVTYRVLRLCMVLLECVLVVLRGHTWKLR